MTDCTRGDRDTSNRSPLVAHGSRRWISVAAALGVALALGTPATAAGQSAADKATARQLATEGIKLFRDGKYADALDRLQRAESLYDAPVHLIYIARAQVKLGQLVEGAESYRRLIRMELPESAPPAFHQAVEDGKAELAPLEGQIPAVRIKVSPDNVAGLEVTLDSEKVPVAALGVDRPANPGDHKVHAIAPGYQAADATVTLSGSEHKEVALTLTPGAGGTPAGTTSSGAGATTAGGVAAGGSTVETRTENRGLGFFVGTRVGLVAPTGDASSGQVLALNPANKSIAMSDLFGVGAGLELHGGVRFLGRFSGYLLYEHDFFQSGRVLDDVTGYVNEVTVTSKTGADNFGFGGSYDITDGPFRFVGQLALLPVHSYQATQTVDGSLGCSSHKNTLTYTGGALRLGAVGAVELSHLVALTPTIEATFGQFSHFEATTGCQTTAPNPFRFIPANQTKVSMDLSSPTTHTTWFAGVGVDFHFGGSNPLK